MTTSNYTNLIESLKSISRGNCEADSRRGMEAATSLVKESDISESEKETVISAIRESANPSGWYYSDNGVKAAISSIDELITENSTQGSANSETSDNSDSESVSGFNYRNLNALVSSGQIFSVEFIKRTTGELRKMTCRIGVKKHLRGGRKTYDSKAHDLLTVFDMQANGYRSIPIETIQRLCVGGQSFDFAGV